MTSDIYNVANVPVPGFSGSNRHPGVEALLGLMGDGGFKFYESSEEGRLSGPGGSSPGTTSWSSRSTPSGSIGA